MKIFDHIGRAFTSIGAVIFVMSMVVTSMIFFSHTLFIDVFPDTMAGWEKAVATWAMALGWECTVLITTCNAKHINKHIPLIMAIASGIIMLFFIQAFDFTLTALKVFERWFVGTLAATINYVYAELFYKKWKERTDVLDGPDKLQQTEAALQQTRATLQETAAALQHSRATLEQGQAELKELRAFRKKVEAELTCPHCGNVQPSSNTLRSHIGHCKKKQLATA